MYILANCQDKAHRELKGDADVIELVDLISKAKELMKEKGVDTITLGEDVETEKR